MADVVALVWHDLDGNITAVGHQVAGSDKTIEPIASDDRRVLKLTVSDEHIRRLHLTHCIDVDNARLVPRAEGSVVLPSPESAS
jgi:hypothetical protein